MRRWTSTPCWRASPQLVLVDELAHTNVPGSRHPKRYLDVEELLSAGIDVYTTVNIQHVESLNDVVAQITRIRVRETVPDSIIDRADEIELIDLTPDDLMQRLQEGKVYVPEQAERALDHYFSPGNLTALRELALRRTAQRVDEQMLKHMQAHAIAGPWAGRRAGARLHQRGSARRRPGALRQAARRSPARAVDRAVRRDAGAACSSPKRSATASPKRCGSAERLGGEAITIPGGGGDRRRRARLRPGPQRHADRRRQVQRARAGLRCCTARSCTSSSAAPATSAYTSSPASDEARAGSAQDGSDARPKRARRARPYVVALLAVAAALGVGKLVQPLVGLENVDWSS